MTSTGTNVETIDAWIQRCDARSELRRVGASFHSPATHIWDPYNELARRILYCTLLEHLVNDHVEAGARGPSPRILSRREFASGEITGTVASLAEGGDDASSDNDYGRVTGGVVRECGYNFGFCLLKVDGPIHVAVLLHPGEEPADLGQLWTYPNYDGYDWNIIAGPCAGAPCPYRLHQANPYDECGLTAGG